MSANHVLPFFHETRLERKREIIGQQIERIMVSG